MSKRLQVIIDETDLKTYETNAELEGVTLSEWVRQSLRDASQRKSLKDPERKLRAIKEAMTFEAPAPPIEQMLQEIERGYLED